MKAYYALKAKDAGSMLKIGIAALILLAGVVSQPSHAMSNSAAPLLSPLKVGAARGDRALLWKVERAGLRPSYVFGTLHSQDPRVAELSPAVIKAFQLSDVFAMEMIPDHAALAQMSASMFIDNGPDLKTLLGDASFAKAAAIMNKYGFSRICFVGRPNPPMTYFRR